MGFSEMLLLSLLGFLLFGPKKTAELAREIGQHVANFKRAAGDLQAQLVNELPTEMLGSEVDHLRQTIIGTLSPDLTAAANEDHLANFAKANSEVEAAIETPQLVAEVIHPQLSDAHPLISDSEVDHLRQTIIGTLSPDLTAASEDHLANFAKANPEAEAALETPQLAAEVFHPQLSDAHPLISETIQ